MIKAKKTFIVYCLLFLPYFIFLRIFYFSVFLRIPLIFPSTFFCPVFLLSHFFFLLNFIFPFFLSFIHFFISFFLLFLLPNKVRMDGIILNRFFPFMVSDFFFLQPPPHAYYEGPMYHSHGPSA